jgi:hypothetical protein
MAKHRGFNFCLIGFKNTSTGDHAPYLHCPVHIGRELIVDPKDPDTLMCPDCGLKMSENELMHDTTPTSKFGTPNKGPMLFQPNKKKKLKAEDGDIIPADDTVAISDLTAGRKILSYNEYKVEK